MNQVTMTQSEQETVAKAESSPREPANVRVLFGGLLMGVANLVPGVSGGTMILALGLYDRFIHTVAQATSLRWDAAMFRFLALVLAGAAVAILGLSSPAVWLVTEHRWIAYSLFVGMTLGGVSELWKVIKPLGMKEIVPGGIGLGLMAAFAWGMSGTVLPQNFIVLTLVGALAASSMILPGISGSYILLIFGLYDVVVGSIRPSELMGDFSASFSILLPIGIGVALGIGGLSNVLKVLLEKFERPTHAALLGLLLGSVLGLWPFQESVDPDLSPKAQLKSVQLVLEGNSLAEVEAETGIAITEGDAREYAQRYAGMTGADLKLAAMQLERYAPSGGRMGLAVLLFAGGFLMTRMLGGSREG